MQNQKTLQQMIREYELNMPPEIMNLIKSFDWKKEVRMIVNQNQLMLDIAADLEESVYLLILGIVDIEEVFERLVEVHELPQDKVQKILTEVEKQIFDPMHHKLTELEKEDTTNIPMNSTVSKEVDMNISRDQILNEIEKDIEVIEKPVMPKINVNLNQTNTYSEDASVGVREPFSLSDAPKSTPVKPVMQETIHNPIASTLTQPTVARSSEIPPPPPPVRNYAADPYREPIE
jgi:hypothetical protein